MTIADVMTTPVTTVQPRLSATKAWQLMERKGIHHLVVIDGARIVGVVSERDRHAAACPVLLADSSVSDVMSTDVASIEPTASVGEGAALMRRRSVGCLPVVRGWQLVGIVTISDLLDVIADGGCRRAARPRGRRPPRIRSRRISAH